MLCRDYAAKFGPTEGGPALLCGAAAVSGAEEGQGEDRWRRGEGQGRDRWRGGGSSNDTGASGRLLFQALFFFSALLFFMTFNDLTKINSSRRK